MNETKLNLDVEFVVKDIENHKFEYLKLVIVFIGIALTSFLIFNVNSSAYVKHLGDVEKFISIFMGTLLSTFAMFKIINFHEYVKVLSNYDIVAKKSQLYAKFYPVILLFLGCAMFVFASNPIIYFLALMFSFTALISVYFEIQTKKQIRCVCLGDFIKLPITTVSVFEDGSMFVLAAFMFLMRI